MKLYDLKRGEFFVCLDDKMNVVSPVLQFDHLDGMYSICFTRGHASHVAGFTPVKKVRDFDDDGQ